MWPIGRNPNTWCGLTFASVLSSMGRFSRSLCCCFFYVFALLISYGGAQFLKLFSRASGRRVEMRKLRVRFLRKKHARGFVLVASLSADPRNRLGFLRCLSGITHRRNITPVLCAPLTVWGNSIDIPPRLISTIFRNDEFRPISQSQ